MIPSLSFLSRRTGATAAGIFSMALASVLLLCGAGPVAIQNFSPQGAMQADLNAGGHSLTNVASITLPAGTLTGGVSLPPGGDDSFRESLLTSGGTYSNVMRFRNPASDGFAAVSFADYLGNEHAALGFGQNVGATFGGATYFESSDLLGGTTQVTTWSSGASTLTLSAPNANIHPGQTILYPGIGNTGDNGFNEVTSVSGTTVGLLTPTSAAGSAVTLTYGFNPPPRLEWVQTASTSGLGSQSYIRESITTTDVNFWQYIPVGTTQVSNFDIADTGIKFGVPVDVTAGPVIFSGTDGNIAYNDADIVLGGPNSADNSYRPVILVNTSTPSTSTCLEFARGTTSSPTSRFRLDDDHSDGDGSNHFRILDDINGQALLDINAIASGASTFTFAGSGSFSGLTDSGLSSGQIVIAGGPMTGVTPGTGVAAGLAAPVNSGSGFETRTDADGRYQLQRGTTTITASGASPAVTIDLSLYKVAVVDLTGASGTPTIAFSNFSTANSDCLIKMIQGATALNCTFPSGTIQAGGGGATYTASGAGTVDAIAVQFTDGTHDLIAVSAGCQ